MSKNLPSFLKSQFHNPWRNRPSNWLSLNDEFDRMFSRFPFAGQETYQNPEVFSPSCEAEETDKEYMFKFDIPGMGKDDLKIELDDNHLTVSGERREEKKEGKGKHAFSEISYGSFMRSFTLPTSIDEEKCKADYKDGVLTIVARKTDSPKRREISIR